MGDYMVPSPPTKVFEKNIHIVNRYLNRFMVYQTINYLCQVQTMARLETEVDQTSTMTNGTCHQCLVRLYAATNKEDIIGLTVMTKHIASQSIDIFRHFNSNNNIYMIGL